MLYSFIVSYIFGILSTVLFSPDRMSFIFIFILSFTASFLYRTYKSIKDTQSDKLSASSFIKKRSEKIIFYSTFLCCFLIFTAAHIYTKQNLKQVHFYETTAEEVVLSGKIIHSETGIKSTKILVEVAGIKNERGESVDIEDIRYAEVSVSPLQEIHLYVDVTITANTVPLYINSVSEKRPFFQKYETEKIIHSPSVRLQSYNNLVYDEGYTRTLSEKFLILLYETKKIFLENLQQNISEPYASVASGILLGEGSYLSLEIKDIFRDSGLLHIMVLSGTNISLVILTIWILLGRLSIKKRVFTSLALSWIFIIMTGLTPPSVRAGVMASLLILSQLAGRSASPIRILVYALFLEVLVSPLSLLHNASLHLSFLATFALFVVVPLCAHFLQKYIHRKYLTTALALTLAMSLSITPYLLGLAGRSSIFGSILTILVEPLVLLSMIFSTLTIAGSFVHNFLGQIFGLLAGQIIFIIVEIATFAAENFSLVEVNLSRNLVIIYYTLFISGSYYFYKKFVQEKIM